MSSTSFHEIFSSSAETFLIWSLMIGNEEWSQNVAIFFLGCVAVAGLYGFLTADKKIIFVQTIPSVIVILILLLG